MNGFEIPFVSSIYVIFLLFPRLIWIFFACKNVKMSIILYNVTDFALIHCCWFPLNFSVLKIEKSKWNKRTNKQTQCNGRAANLMYGYDDARVFTFILDIIFSLSLSLYVYSCSPVQCICQLIIFSDSSTLMMMCLTQINSVFLFRRIRLFFSRPFIVSFICLFVCLVVVDVCQIVLDEILPRDIGHFR